MWCNREEEVLILDLKPDGYDPGIAARTQHLFGKSRALEGYTWHPGWRKLWTMDGRRRPNWLCIVVHQILIETEDICRIYERYYMSKVPVSMSMSTY